MFDNSRYKIGHITKFQKTYLDDDVKNFAEITADNNLVHLDENYATTTRFGKKIVHGMFVASMFSKIFGTIYPGTGAIYLSQTLNFRKPVFIGDSIEATIELIKLHESKPIGTFKTICTNLNNEIVIDGEAILLLP